MTAIAGVVGLFAGVFVGRTFKKNGYVLPENETTTKAIGFLPLIIAILLLLALIFGLKLGENGAFCKEVNFAQWELSAKFSSVTFDVLWRCLYHRPRKYHKFSARSIQIWL